MSSDRQNDFTKFVLIVDDEQINREILGMTLSGSYEVLYASDGEEAIEKIKAFSDILSLVLLDILMPKMDGYQVLEEMQADPSLSKIPVIVLTSEKEAEIKSLQMGAADFLTKPYDLPPVILARIDHAITLYENTLLIQSTENDTLTGLYSRDFFYQYCDRFVKHNADVLMDAIVLNINRFHMINALYGRHFGDKVLCSVSNRLRHVIQTHGGLACRYDADTFYLLVPHMDDYYNDLYNSILIGVVEVLKDGDTRLRIGINSMVDTTVSYEDNFGWALQACNSLRGLRNEHIALYDSEMKSAHVREAMLVDDFDKAISEGQFVVYYQPKFNITGEKERLVSAEALVRWKHPALGLISPGEFIPLFEDNGLISKLDRYVWNEVARQIGEWFDKYGVYMSVSVNVSRVDIYSSEMGDYLLEVVMEHCVPADRFLLEITESAYADDSDQIVDVMSELRESGFKIEMDDFGTGYSSLNMLYALPIDILKIDKAFLKNIIDDDRARNMLKMVISIAKAMNMPVIAEGVEEKAEVDILKEMGCDVIQGFYFSKPLPVEDMNRMIEEKINDIR